MALDRLMKYLRLTPAEEKDLKLLFVQSLFSGFGSSFFFVVVSTYFIKKTSIQSLPPAYILSGIFGYVLITMYKKWQQKSGVVPAYTIGYIIYGLSALLLYAGRFVYSDASPVAVYIAYIGFVVVLPFASMQALGFSTICLRVFNIAQSKRLLALIGTGEVIASIAAYLIIPFLTKIMGGSAPLLLISAIANIVAIIPLGKTYQNNKEKLDSARLSNIKKKMNLDFFRKDRFYFLIAIVTVFSVMAVYFADYAYLLSVRYIAAESGTEIAVVVAVVFSIIKSGELLASLLSGNIIRSYGMKISLMMLPVALVVSTLIGFATGIIFISIPFFLVIFLLFNKWCERVIRKGVTIPAMKVVYQVTNPAERAQLQTSVEGTITQYATIAAGVFLLIVSWLVNSNDILIFLRIIAFIYLIAFAGWALYTLLLYKNYRVKIEEYLHTIRKPGDNIEITEFAEGGGTDEKVKNTAGQIHLAVQRALSTKLATDKENLADFITFYNPAIKNTVDANSLLRKINTAYYNNENFFSRILIIRYMELQDENTRLDFVKEYFGISELQLRLLIIKMLNKKGLRIKPGDVFFFKGLCEETATGIMWAESAINDIEDEVDTDLVNGLKQQIITLQNLLFELLKILYAKESIQAVQGIMNSKDQSLENNLFAIELLDNVLEGEIKTLLIPVLENNSYNAKKERLYKIIPINNLSCPERLKQILMANFMTIGPNLKQLALEEYYRITDDKAILTAFASSHIENLHSVSAVLLNETNTNVYMAKIKATQDMDLPSKINPDLLAYFVKWGLFARGKRNNAPGEYMHKQAYQFNTDHLMNVNYENYEMSIDILGLSLILNLNQII